MNKLTSLIGAAALGVASAGYDWTYGNYALWHSEATYCDPDSYLTRTYKGVLAGFTPVYAIYDPEHDTNGEYTFLMWIIWDCSECLLFVVEFVWHVIWHTIGYIGYTTSQSTIYVAFRGSESIQNWIDNLDAVLTTYSACSGCEVHKGFYGAEQDCISDVVSQVKSLKSRFPSYKVIVTGHSLGNYIYVHWCC